MQWLNNIHIEIRKSETWIGEMSAGNRETTVTLQVHLVTPSSEIGREGISGRTDNLIFEVSDRISLLAGKFKPVSPTKYLMEIYHF